MTSNRRILGLPATILLVFLLLGAAAAALMLWIVPLFALAGASGVVASVMLWADHRAGRDRKSP